MKITAIQAFAGIWMMLLFGTVPVLNASARHSDARQADTLPDDLKGYYTGRLGCYPIELYIEKDQQNLKGRYIQRYSIGQRSIDLSGYVDRQGQLHLEGKGIFIGTLKDGRFEGLWHRAQDSREKYPFELHEKDPDYYGSDYWTAHPLASGGQIKIPRNSSVERLPVDELFSGRISQLQSIVKDTAYLQQGYRIDLPVQDSAIVSRLKLELGVYRGIDSLQQLLPKEPAAVRAAEILRLDDKQVRLLGFEEGTTGGSYRSMLYFFRSAGNPQAYLFNLSFSYTNPWVYGNPYSKEEYEGPPVNDINRLVEIAEMIVGQL